MQLLLTEADKELTGLKERYNALVSAGRVMRENQKKYFKPATRTTEVLVASKKAEDEFDLLIGIKQPNNQTTLL